MSEATRNAVRATFTAPKLEQELRVLRFDGVEGISQSFRFTILLAVQSSKLPLASVVGQEGLLTITRGAAARHVHGMVLRIQQRESEGPYTVYQATLVPAALRLGFGTDCRCFQGKSAQQIVEQLLDAGHISHRFRSRGNAAPASRDYCVQYRESDWDFVCRLLEEEGYFFYFEHGREEHVLQIANDPTLHPDLGGSDLRFHPPDTKMAVEEHVYRFYFSEAMRADRVTLNDFNFDTPGLSLKVDSGGAGGEALEVYDYPGQFQSPEAGSQAAAVRLEELEVAAHTGEGHSDCTRLSAGHTFIMADHPCDDFNRKYVVTQVRHFATKGTQDLEAGMQDQRCAYSNTFRCQPHSVAFRPPRRTRKPQMRGVQTAVVVGPSGQEIHTDAQGRVKVQFHWDRQGKGDERSSCWLRVSQPWAGAGSGAAFIPRVGNEVVVDFIDGDPDRPLVTGSVYHARNLPPLDLPGAMTRTAIKSCSSPGGGGSNEIRLEDKQGAEELYTHAQRDQRQDVEHDMTTTVGRDAALQVRTGDRTVSVDVGDYKLSCGAGNLSASAAGEVKLTGAMGGVSVKGDARGVSVIGTGTGVTINGTGAPGVAITGTPALVMQAAAATNITSPMLIYTAGDAVFKFDKTGLNVNGKQVIMVGPGGAKVIPG